MSTSYAIKNQKSTRNSFDLIVLAKSGLSLINSIFDIIYNKSIPIFHLLNQAFKKLSKKAKINTVFSTSILGRVMDCKVQDLVYDRDCRYYLSDDWVQLKNQKRNKVSKESIFTFSLRTYCISQAITQTVRTFKPKQKGVESFYQLNQI